MYVEATLSVNTPIFGRLHLTSSHQVVHKAPTLYRQTALSAAAVDTLLQLFHPALSLSFSAVLLNAVSILPTSGALPVSTLLQFYKPLSYPFVIMCPMNFHLLLTFSPRFSISAISIASLLLIPSSRHILSIRQRHLFWKTSMLFSSHSVHLPCLSTIHHDWSNQSLI